MHNRYAFKAASAARFELMYITLFSLSRAQDRQLNNPTLSFRWLFLLLDTLAAAAAAVAAAAAAATTRPWPCNGGEYLQQLVDGRYENTAVGFRPVSSDCWGKNRCKSSRWSGNMLK